MAYAIFDIDGTIGAAPTQSQEIASALIAAGHRVGVLTGTSNNPVTQEDWDNKANYLNSLGFGESYHDLTVISNQVLGGLAQAKADFLSANGVDIYIDNSQSNAQAAVEAGVAFVLVPWASKV
jgi:hypothetical protein